MSLSLLVALGLLLPAQPVPLNSTPADSGWKSTPQAEVTVSILFDNYPAAEGVRTGWGYSALLETPGHTLLFDAGADGEALLENFRLLGKDPMDIEVIVISHAHEDHTGGLQSLLELGLRPTIVLLPGFPPALHSGLPEGVTILYPEPGEEIQPGIRTTGQMGTEIPEQALILETAEGTAVLTGCAHPGVIRMVERAREIQPGPLYLVAGGFHIMEASREEIQAILGRFRTMGVERAGPTHCSGEAAMAAFQEAYGEAFLPLGAGRVFKLLQKTGS